MEWTHDGMEVAQGAVTAPLDVLTQQARVEGPAGLEDAQLLALLLEEPSPRGFPMQPLWRLCGRRVEELCEAGWSQAHALRLAVALELGTRALRAPLPVMARLTQPSDVAALVGPRLAGLPREQVVALVLDARKRLLAYVPVAQGWAEGVPVDPREVFRAALLERGAGVILVHNHPSGDPTPSLEDRTLTRRLCRAGDTLGVRLLDHVVVARGGYASLAALGACA